MFSLFTFTVSVSAFCFKSHVGFAAMIWICSCRLARWLAHCWRPLLMFLANVSLMFQDVDALSDEEQGGKGGASKGKSKESRKRKNDTEDAAPKQKAKAKPKQKATPKTKTRDTTPKPKGKAKAKPASDANTGGPTPKVKSKADEAQSVDDTAEGKADSSKAGRPRSSMKKPAAAAANPSASGSSEKPVSVWKYQYKTGVYGFKCNRTGQKEVLRVGCLKDHETIMLFCSEAPPRFHQLSDVKSESTGLAH